ncbi:MAG: putative ABC transporter permease [Eubacterium sp.]
MKLCRLVFIYVLGGLVGTLWETFLNFINGNGFVYCNGSIFTPVNFVYGFGAVIIVACLHSQTEWWRVYLIGAVGGGVVEYLLNFLEEKLLGTRSWNYDGKTLNINGRTTLPYMAVWGLLCVAVIFIIYKPLSRFLDKIPPDIQKTASVIIGAILLLDLFITVSAVLRYSARNANQNAFTALGRILDRYFNDAFMIKRFPKMKFS